MSHPSSREDLVLHAVRLLGVATSDDVAARFGLGSSEAGEILLDDQAYGWVSYSEFAGAGGWSLTERGRVENERRLRTELDGVARGRSAVEAVHADFLPCNARLQQACTDWQITPSPGRPLAVNDHSDPRWDALVIYQLGRLADDLAPLAARLTSVLARFAGYDGRFAAAVDRARAGDSTAVIGRDRTTCHAVWFELHEDLIATLGLARTS
jgi:hypothetical protein